MQKMIKILELFGGIGACTKALERIGVEYEIADYVEIDKYATASYNAIHGTNFKPQDIRDWDKDIDVDLIMHGSPCQDFSLAGRQAGGDEGSGTRSSLMYETLRIVEKLKPKYVIWENVKNLISDKHIHNFNKYIDRMTSLGYDSWYQVLNAKDYGIPQNRERVFTVSIRQDLNKGFAFPKPVPLELRLKDMLEENVDEKYYLSEKTLQYFTRNSIEQQEKGNGVAFEPTELNGAAKTITAREGTHMQDNFIDETKPYEIKPAHGWNKGSCKQTDVISTIDKSIDFQHIVLGEPVAYDEQNGYLRDDNCVRSLTTDGSSPKHNNRVVELGNYSPSKHNAARVVDKENIAPAVMENHGTVTAITEKPLLIKNATEKGYLEAYEGDGVDISSRMQYHRGTVQPGMAQTITTAGGGRQRGDS